METTIWPIFGGALIGASAVILMLSIGKIAGISGIAWGALSRGLAPTDRFWRWWFLLGVVGGAYLLHFLTAKPIPLVIHAPSEALLAGLLVGIGVKLGNGCTSGHGVCGVSRFSGRSIVATIVFMGAAILTVGIR